MNITQKASKVKPSVVLVSLAVLFGGYIRLSSVLEASFPLNDGGLFYTMTQDLIANGFRIPVFSTYNHLNIPFAYPPLQFAAAGLLSTLFQWNLLDIFRFLPAIFAVFCIPAFYVLARELLQNELQAGLATLIFAFIPSTFDWLIMGGGITRAPAFFFALLSLLSIYRLFTRQEKKDVFITAILSALTVLSHPETALHTAASALVFFLFLERNKKGVLKSIYVAGLVLLLTSPWWVSVMVNHGISPFLAAGQTGWHNYSSFIRLFVSNLIGEYELTSISVFAMIGFLILVVQKRYFLPVWFLVIYLSEPRSAPLFIAPVMAIFAALTLIQVMNLLNKFEKKPASDTEFDLLFSGRITKVLMGILFAQWLFSSYSTSLLLTQSYFLSEPEKDSFNWIAENTPPDSRFLVLTGKAPLTDPVSEWFPALTGRVSIGTAQGYEWIADKDFQTVLEESQQLQTCLYKSIQCLEDWSAENGQSFHYLYLNHASVQSDENSEAYPAALAQLLLNSADYSVVYEKDGVLILKSAAE